jgi:WD40 repeat protein
MNTSPDLAGFNLHIEGYQAHGGGGGPGNMSLIYTTIPKGTLNIIFTNPLISGPQETWQTVWQPETARLFPAEDVNPACFNPDTIELVPELPVSYDGIVVTTQLNPALKILLSRLKGTDQQLIASGAARATFNHDGSLLAYSTMQGIVVQNITNGTKNSFSGTFGRDLRWSPDDQYLAVVNKDDNFGIHVINLKKRTITRLTNLGYESVAGWSPDVSTLFYTIPGSDGKGFLLRAIDVVSRETRDMFTLENSSLKAPMPVVSPDGKWIAYRAFDNGSLYIMNMNGDFPRLVLDNPALAINGIVWDNDGKYLGVSLITQDQSDGEVFIIDPFSCENYRLSKVSGEVNGIIIH